ncbi:MAG TPA: single-stranded DNA-binding protein [Bryobacteraceae bacterium]|nr:single-stranded DNA-binding protein [Bryobacteraceae bacterium]
MASRSINKAILLGNLGKDAETKFTPSGTARTSFTLATSRRWKDQQTGDWKEETDWHNVVLWRSENLANYLLKGKQVYVEGRISNRSYEQDGVKKFFTEIVADEVILLGGRGEGGGGPEEFGQPASMPRSAAPRGGGQPARQAPASRDESSFDPGITDDDVPF